MRYLLDTSVISELRRPSGSQAVKRWVAVQRTHDLYLSVVTVLEIETGILGVRRHDERQAEVLQDWFERAVLTGFEGRLLPVDLPVVRRVAPLHVPDRAPQHDALIAGTALAHDLTVVTRNVLDFEAVQSLNPWEIDPA